jgi:hypothetical protein
MPPSAFVFVPPPWRGVAPRSLLPTTKSPVPSKRSSVPPRAQLLGNPEAGSHKPEAVVDLESFPTQDDGDGAEKVDRDAGRPFEGLETEDDSAAQDVAPNESPPYENLCDAPVRPTFLFIGGKFARGCLRSSCRACLRFAKIRGLARLARSCENYVEITVEW